MQPHLLAKDRPALPSTRPLPVPMGRGHETELNDRRDCSGNAIILLHFRDASMYGPTLSYRTMDQSLLIPILQASAQVC